MPPRHLSLPSSWERQQTPKKAPLSHGHLSHSALLMPSWVPSAPTQRALHQALGWARERGTQPCSPCSRSPRKPHMSLHRRSRLSPPVSSGDEGHLSPQKHRTSPHSGPGANPQRSPGRHGPSALTRVKTMRRGKANSPRSQGAGPGGRPQEKGECLHSTPSGRMSKASKPWARHVL